MIGFDWYHAYLPALLAFLTGASPYSGAFLNPPWLLPVLSPLALLPPEWGFYAIFTLNLLAFVVVMMRLRVNYVLLILTVALSGIIFCSTNGNIDGLVALGAILPPPVAMFFLLLKPQLGLGVVIFLVIRAIRAGKLIYVTAPVALAYILSFAAYGNWMSTGVLIWSSPQVFPLGVPFGLALLYYAVKRDKLEYALGVGVLLSPYVNSFSWSFLWLSLVCIASDWLRSDKCYMWRLARWSWR